MTFDWDQSKNVANIEKHGIGFADAEELFRNPMVVRADLRRAYGERRYMGLGLVRGRVLAIAFTIRGDVIRIISMRRANRRESRRYEEEIRNRLGTC